LCGLRWARSPVAIVFDLTAAVLAIFVLRRMELPSHAAEPSDAPHPKAAGADR
jgi:hypothetical protein